MPTIYKKKYHKKENTESEKVRRNVYSSARWLRLRSIKLVNEPLCEKCLEKGIVEPAIDVHHVTSFVNVEDESQRKFLAYDYENLLSLCKKCHQLIHNKSHT